jgi:transcriptional regulator of acetoin/glycerol metabolism
MPAQQGGEALQDAAQKAIRERVLAALEQTGGNQSEAARLLGVSRTTVWKYAR